MRWAYGITTVKQRRGDLLPRTLASLRNAGFERPRLFVDGISHEEAVSYEREFGLEVTARTPPNVRIGGSWLLAMHELLLREPTAERFALFQDDCIAVRNLRQYLERCYYPLDAYFNAYLFPQNEELVPRTAFGSPVEGWYPSNQKGKGAVALVFSRQAVLVLLASPHMVERALDASRGWRAVDGGIVTAMKKAGWREYVHFPSLVQHTGEFSSMGNRQHPQAESFRGENFDALTLLGERGEPNVSCSVRADGPGVTAYDGLPESLRVQLVNGWRRERDALRQAIQEDLVRQRRAAGRREQMRYERIITHYREQLQRIEVNDPPFAADPRLRDEMLAYLAARRNEAHHAGE